jgi:hypothetical protein
MPLPGLKGLKKCGAVLVLKGLVFPQWRRRPIALLNSRLFLYPGKSFMFLTFLVKRERNDSEIYKLYRLKGKYGLCRLNVFKADERNAEIIECSSTNILMSKDLLKTYTLP